MAENQGYSVVGLASSNEEDFQYPADASFTGFVCDTLGNPEHLSGYDRAQYNEFLCLAPDTPVWISEPVTWLSEFRYYVIDGEVRGEGRYDDATDNMPEPDFSAVREMAATMAHTPDAPDAFSLDVGVLDTGETALIEHMSAHSPC